MKNIINIRRFINEYKERSGKNTGTRRKNWRL